MSDPSHPSTNLAQGIIVGIVAFSIFGLVTYGILLFGGLKSPADRIAAGDFSDEVKELRTGVTDSVKSAQSKAFNEEKVVAAMKSFKANPASASAIPVPGLVVEEPAEVVEEPAPKAEPAKKKPANKPAPKKQVKPKAAEPKVEEIAPKARKRNKVNRAKGKGKQ